MANKTSKSNEAYFARYKQANVYASNRKRKLERTLRKQPNNLQIALAIKNVSNYRRKDPKEPYWSHQMIETAKLFKEFVGVFDRGVFNQKPEDQEAARRVRNANLFTKVTKPATKRISEFSMAARAHGPDGSLVWS